MANIGRTVAPGTATEPPGWFRQWRILLAAAFRQSLIYKGNLILMMAGSAALQGTQLLFIGVLLDRFGVIAGWSTAQIAFLYGLRLTAHGVGTVFFGQHLATDMVIREGEYDRFLLRPVPPLIQLLTRWFNLGTLGDLVLGLGILVAAITLAPIDWTPWLVALTVAAAIGGGLLEAGLQIGLAGLSFRLGSTRDLKVSVDNTLTDFGAYPLPVFGPAGVFALTFALPLAFIAYLPATVVLGKTDELLVPTWLADIAPMAGPLMLAFGWWFFMRQSRHYTSPGA
ncbi:ABC transporter permease [Curtobacterium sp. PhB78]|uniref:ABC transporter permease n=1 Tax=Curtobacterium sp. PhB78 TaxID=2485102 RepID=UPI000F469BA1|nr:ABC-2 family transporter protein [Curtobacterium sp. PhB78]ROS47311.1 ABC-2 type transport system permease protein [Curtobacterium sp. PhB78]